MEKAIYNGLLQLLSSEFAHKLWNVGCAVGLRSISKRYPVITTWIGIGAGIGASYLVEQHNLLVAYQQIEILTGAN